MRGVRAACVLVAVACWAALAAAYSGGAPVDVCGDMTPKHPAPPQKSAMPYEIKVNAKHVAPGGLLKITVGGKVPFKGFLVQVRRGDEPVGKFLVSDSDKYVKTINCGKGEQVVFEMLRQLLSLLAPELMRLLPAHLLQNAVTHKNSEPKNDLNLDWQAPSGLKDQVQIYVTVAQDGGTYWVRQPTLTIKVN